MTPADKRITDLIDRWLASLDLHLKYAELDDAAYAQVQPWPPHDRPTRWIVELARQKTLDLKAQCESRQAMGDSKFSESLELMAFLANLVGSQHLQRFIPIADPAQAAAPAPQGKAASTSKATRSDDSDATREMPRLRAAGAATGTPAPAAAKHDGHSRATGKGEGRKQPAKAAQVEHGPAAPKTQSGADTQDKVIADAVRLLKWGREWHELAELIARMAERPALPEVRRILRAHKSEIESQTAVR